MKFIKKVNIGLILAIIAILAIVIYSIRIESQRKTTKEEIKKSCEEFIDLTEKYCILPTEFQTIGVKATDVNLDNFKSEMEKELKAKTTSETTADIQKTILTQVVENQLIDTNKIIVDLKKEITKISNYEFDGNQVTVTFDSKTVVKQKYNDINEQTGESSEKIKENAFEIKGESITLEKVDNTWKVVYANLQYQDMENPSAYGFSTTIM